MASISDDASVGNWLALRTVESAQALSHIVQQEVVVLAHEAIR